jgi:hypothetical protein
LRGAIFGGVTMLLGLSHVPFPAGIRTVDFLLRRLRLSPPALIYMPVHIANAKSCEECDIT